MKLLLLAVGMVAVLALSGCGTQMSMEGSVCGQPLNVTLNDQKERAAFRASARCADGSTVEIESSESSPSAQQADAVAQLTELVMRLAPP